MYEVPENQEQRDNQEQESSEMKEAQAEEQDEDQEMEMELNQRRAQVSEEVSQSWSEWNTGQSRGVSELVRVEDWAEQRRGLLEEVKSLQK